MADKETVHSDMLAYLFNPYENHYLKESMINELFKHLSKKDANYINLLLLDYSDLEVYREYTIDNGRRIDILLISKRNKGRNRKDAGQVNGLCIFSFIRIYGFMKNEKTTGSCCSQLASVWVPSSIMRKRTGISFFFSSFSTSSMR